MVKSSIQIYFVAGIPYCLVNIKGSLRNLRNGNLLNLFSLRNVIGGDQVEICVADEVYRTNTRNRKLSNMLIWVFERKKTSRATLV